MKNKGFTLIELLAVIVILAIVALIATPTILNVVEKARKSAAESSILGYISAVEKQYMINEMDETYPVIPDKDGETCYEVSTLKTTYGVTVKGDYPDDTSKVCIAKGAVTEKSTFVTKDQKYTVTYNSTSGKWVAAAK